MGIKGLRDLIKREFKTRSFEDICPSSDFHGKCIAIDASIYLYIYKCTYGQDFLKPFETMINIFKDENISLIFVFDGQHPEEKLAEQKKRNSQRELQKKKLKDLSDDLEKYKHDGKISDNLQKAHDKYLYKNSSYKNLTKFSYFIAKNSLEKIKNNIIDLTPQDILGLKDLLDMYDVKYFHARGEAEVIASSMVKQKIVDAVMTRDSDALACGATTIITNVNLYSKELTVINFQNILTTFNLSYESWLDLCIMCGTDYNTNIPKIGPVRSLQLIRQYESLEEISKTNDTEILNFKIVRTLFKTPFDENIWKGLQETVKDENIVIDENTVIDENNR